jgi:hypothetical protein
VSRRGYTSRLLAQGQFFVLVGHERHEFEARACLAPLHLVIQKQRWVGHEALGHHGHKGGTLAVQAAHQVVVVQL